MKKSNLQEEMKRLDNLQTRNQDAIGEYIRIK